MGVAGDRGPIAGELAGDRRWQPSPWVVERRDRISFQLQPLPSLSQLLPSVIYDDPEPIKRAIAAAQLAEELGFDAVSFGDHPLVFDCWIWLAAVATVTRRIRLGPGVACAPYRPPVATARLASDLDHLSDGRLVLGLGSGWFGPEFAALGLPFPAPGERGAMLAEALAVITGVWGPGPFSFQGRHYTIADVHITPPRQRPRPPMLIAGGGERVTLRLVAEYGDACNIGAVGPSGGADTPAAVAAKLAALRRHCEAIGRPFDDILRTHFTGWLILGEDERGVAAKRARYADRPGTRAIDALTTAGAIAHFQALADVGIQYFVVQSWDAADEETFRLLAEEVAPHIRPVRRGDGAG
jgi:alkanesulfonate monooxygenase SsuD/methylene tetrahydromethanopterin reductase-like flavin-dependent oxidoreductase (luciferase family)